MTPSGEVPEWIGHTVFDVSGEEVGKVSEVYTGSTHAFVLGLETEPGMGIALPANRLKIFGAKNRLQLRYSRAQLADAPTWRSGLEPTKINLESIEGYFDSLDLPGDPEVPYKGGGEKRSDEEKK